MFILKNILTSIRNSVHPAHHVVRALKLSRNKRFIKRKTESKQGPTEAKLIVLGSGAPDQSASVVLDALDQRYLFNCGEGITRFAKENNIPLQTIDHAFFTQNKWNCIGGVTSLMFCTIAQSGYPPTIHGPENLHKIFQRMSFLSTVGGIFKTRFTPDSFNTNEHFEDNKVVIDSVKLCHMQEGTFVYVCKLKACHGQFSLKKTLDLNVPSTLLATLYRGESVTLDDGTVVTPEQVRKKDWHDTYVMFVDIPTKDFLMDLAINVKLRQLVEQTKLCGVQVIVHFTPMNVFKTARYQHFIEQVNPKSNLLVNDSNKYACLKSVYMLQYTLNKIDPKVHQMPGMQLAKESKTYLAQKSTAKKEGTIPKFYNKYILRNELTENCFDMDSDDEMDDKMDNDTDTEKGSGSGSDTDLENIGEVLGQTNDMLEICKEKVPPKLRNEVFPRILFLGTGAADSFLLRNSASILVHISKDHSILLDCGTGTCSQINRFYGDEAPEIYRRIRAVFVSHMHLDHHIGLPELFRWRQICLSENRQPLRIFCPLADFKSWLIFYANNVERIHRDMKLIDNELLFKDKLNMVERSYLNIASIRTCAVNHFRESCAVSLIFPYQNNGKSDLFKLAYSGDTGPCDDFVKIGTDADLLIHEATFQDELRDFAEKHRHSTAAMAIEQSRKMQAKYTILTHFSSRYHLLPYIGCELDENIGIAFDFTEITPIDFPKLNRLFHQYQKTFPEVTRKLLARTKNYLNRDAWE